MIGFKNETVTVKENLGGVKEIELALFIPDEFKHYRKELTIEINHGLSNATFGIFQQQNLNNN